MTHYVKCAVNRCGVQVRVDNEDEEALCRHHWRVSAGPIRRRYEAAWADADAADGLGIEDSAAFARVTSAWRELVDYAARK